MQAPGTIRRLSAIKRGKFRDHLLRLDPKDRLLRFGGYLSDSLIEAYCDALDWGRAIIIAYLVDGEVRGLGELKPMAGARSERPRPPCRWKGPTRTAALAPSCRGLIVIN